VQASRGFKSHPRRQFSHGQAAEQLLRQPASSAQIRSRPLVCGAHWRATGAHSRSGDPNLLSSAADVAGCRKPQSPRFRDRSRSEVATPRFRNAIARNGGTRLDRVAVGGAGSAVRDAQGEGDATGAHSAHRVRQPNEHCALWSVSLTSVARTPRRSIPDAKGLRLRVRRDEPSNFATIRSTPSSSQSMVRRQDLLFVSGGSRGGCLARASVRECHPSCRMIWISSSGL